MATQPIEEWRSEYLGAMDAALEAIKEAASLSGKAHQRGQMTDEYRVELSIAVDECQDALKELLEKSGFTGQ